MNKYEKETLENLIFDQNLTYEKIGEIYGVTGASIRKAANRLGIQLPQRRKINENETFNKGVKRKELKFCLYCNKELEKSQEKYCSKDIIKFIRNKIKLIYQLKLVKNPKFRNLMNNQNAKQLYLPMKF